MILQSLYQLYQRLPEVDRPGFAPLGLSWAIVLNQSGDIQSLQPLRKKSARGNKLVPTYVSAPSPGKRTSGDRAGFLADKTDYIFGFDPSASGNSQASAKLRKRFNLFRDQHLSALCSINHADFEIVCKFLKKWTPEDPANNEKLSKAANAPIKEIIGLNLAFQISGKQSFVHELEEVANFWTLEAGKEKETFVDRCLITGEQETIKLVHPSIKGIYDEPGKPSEKGIVVFQTAKRAFSSYGKDGLQGLNAPISIRAALGYVTALNWLITNRRFRIGDATTVFWTDKPDLAEELLPWMLSGTPVSENDETKRISSILAKVARGTLGADDFGNQNTEYYILGLSPNASRLSVRFWQTGDLGELITNLKLHFNHLEIVQEWDDHSKHPDSQTPNVRELLLQIVPLKDGRRDESKIPPQLSGALMCSILEGTRYPDSLAQGVMNRIRIIEKKPKGDGTLENVTYLRAAILKAWLLRNHNEWLNQQNITMTTALDKDNPSVAYQLGRLFAIYEQAQRAAHEYKLERTIRETMFSSASSTPLAIFVRLDKLNKHHLQKLKQGSKNYLNDLIDEIHQKITASGSYPASLDLKKQSLFCIGYYHQRHDIRQKK
jgi:CRISPR-associated protein Csd1